MEQINVDKFLSILNIVRTVLPVLLSVAEQIAKALDNGGGQKLLAGAPVSITVGEPEATGAAAPGGEHVGATVSQEPAKPAAKAAKGRNNKTTVTREQLNTAGTSKLVELGGKGMPDAEAKKAIKSILTEHAGVGKLKDVPEDKLGAVYNAIQALDFQVEAEGDEDEDDGEI